MGLFGKKKVAPIEQDVEEEAEQEETAEEGYIAWSQAFNQFRAQGYRIMSQGNGTHTLGYPDTTCSTCGRSISGGYCFNCGTQE